MQSEKYDNQKADVLLILTGGSERLNEGFKIFKSTDAKRIIISGVGEGVKKSDFSKYFSSYSVDPKLVILGKTALDTVGNALEANIFMQTNDYKKMLVVTSIYHLPRTKIVFALENPDIDVSYHCVISNNYLSRSWNNIDIIISEYNKTLAYTAIKLNQIFAEYILNQFLKLK
jgi:uncharacterized SAM-binding protein YcdF (DUF218 family)